MIIPVLDNILVKIEDPTKEKVTESGIYIPKTAENLKPDSGIVKAVGDGRILNNGQIVLPSVKVEDKILFNRFAGTQINDGEISYLIIKETDILAKITK